MAKLNELKEQARALEVQGQTAKALAIYRHILKHLEGTSAIKAELPLYVKAGDLLLKLGDSTTAVQMYEKCADAYAANGVGKSVTALVTKMQRVSADKGERCLRLGRLMVEQGHAAASVEVLVEFARLAKLDKTEQALKMLAGRSNQEVKPLIDMLLEAANQGEQGHTERTAERVSLQLTAVSDDLGGLRGKPAAAAPPPAPVPPPREPELVIERGAAMPDVPSLLDERPPSLVTSAFDATVPPEPIPTLPPPPPPPLLVQASAPPRERFPSTPTPSIAATAPPKVTDAAGFRDLGPVVSEERSSSRSRRSGSARVLVDPRRGGRGSKRAVWIAVAAGIVAVGVGLAATGVVSIPGVGAGAIQPASTASADSTRDSLATRADSVTGATAAAAKPDSGTAVPKPATTTVATATRPDSAQSRPAASADSAPRPAAPAPPKVVKAPVIIDGLTVDTVTQVASGGADGYRVVQTLDSGEHITLSVVPVAGATNPPAADEVRMDSLPGDTAIATARFEGYVVNARGKIETSALQMLMGLLVAPK